MTKAKSLLATPKTDARLRKRFRTLGMKARELGVERDDCPYDGLLKVWWTEGWAGVLPEPPKAA